MDFKEIIKRHLENMAQQDFAFAERYNDKKKSLDKYYNKPYSLILSARINDERVETIEVDLTSYKVLQCYGKHDHFTMHHQRILDLVNSQMDTIKAYNRNRRSTINKIAV
jgi:hypothetical protein